MARFEGEQFGNYRVIRELGTGYYTDVYQCQHIQHKDGVAIKSDAFGCDNEQQVQRFLSDARSMITRVRHPHIVPFLDCGINKSPRHSSWWDGYPFFVMDYAPGGSLRQRHPKGSRLQIETIIVYTRQITEALTYLHDQKLYHLHIKPENLLIGKNSEILLGDFGINWTSYSQEDRRIPDNEYLVYMAPEYDIWLGTNRLHGRRISQSFDQYSLGTVIYEWLCGDIPFQTDLAGGKLNTPPQPLHEKIPGVSPAIEAVVMRALATKPEQRFESLQAFAKALEEAAFPPKVILNSPNLTAQQLGNYRLIRLLGRGGFADVYLGQHRRLNTLAAIKVLHSSMSDDDVEEFQKEAQTIANLKHPSIVRVLDFDVDGNTAFLVMDYAANGTLRERYTKGSQLPLTTVVNYVKQVAGALQYAHDQKLIHRDVKPENMLIGPNNEILLSDFGIAAVAHSTRSLKTEGPAGTIYYMAPEQIQGKPRPASDQYALAVVAYEWLTGTRPFNGTYLEIVTQHLTAPFPPLREKNLSVPRVVEQVLNIALAKDPHKRFANVQAFANALEQASK